MSRPIFDANLLRRFVEYRDPVHPAVKWSSASSAYAYGSIAKHLYAVVPDGGPTRNKRLMKLVVESSPPGFGYAILTVNDVPVINVYAGSSFYYPHNGQYTVLLVDGDSCYLDVYMPAIAKSSLFYLMKWYLEPL